MTPFSAAATVTFMVAVAMVTATAFAIHCAALFGTIVEDEGFQNTLAVRAAMSRFFPRWMLGVYYRIWIASAIPISTSITSHYYTRIDYVIASRGGPDRYLWGIASRLRMISASVDYFSREVVLILSLMLASGIKDAENVDALVSLWDQVEEKYAPQTVELYTASWLEGMRQSVSDAASMIDAAITDEESLMSDEMRSRLLIRAALN